MMNKQTIQVNNAAQANNTLYNILDSNTGEWNTYNVVSKWWDGTPMNDSKVDGAIYTKTKDGRYCKKNFTGDVNIKWFGAKGDGITDDHDAIVNATNACKNAGMTIYFPAGTYKVNSLVNVDLINTSWVGEVDSTIITGGFGYAVIQFGNMSDATIKNIFFKTTYVNATLDAGSAVVFSYQQSVQNVKILNCKFSSPDANTSGLVFYANITSPVTNNLIEDLEISDCTFQQIGCIACTLMNRTSSVNGYNFAHRIRFNNNTGIDLGLGGSYGFLLSLDGVGEEFEINNNRISNALGIGIENTGWRNGTFIGNTFSNFLRMYDPFSFSSLPMDRLTIANNSVVGISTGRSNFINVQNSTFNGNYLAASDNPGVFLRQAINNVFVNENYSGVGTALLIGSAGVTTQNNTFRNCRFSTAGNANSSLVRFSDANTQNNFISNCLFYKGTGGLYLDEINGAANNQVFVNEYDGALTSYTAAYLHQYGFTSANLDTDQVVIKNLIQTITGAKTFSIAQKYALIFGGTWTADGAAQTHVSLSPHITARATASDSLSGMQVGPELIAGANNQALYGLRILPTFTLGGFTGIAQIGLSVETGDLVITSGVLKNPNAAISTAIVIIGAGDNSWGWQFTNAGNPTTRNILKGLSGSAENIRLDPGSASWFVNILLVGSSTQSGSDKLQVTGNINLMSAGNKLKIATGTNASAGTATLAAGTVTVATTAVTATSIIFLTIQSLGTVTSAKAIAVTSRTAGTSFTITSADNTDTSTIGWLIIN